MSSESERELSMEELKRLNHLQGSMMRQEPTTAAQPEPHPTQAEWTELMSTLASMEHRVAAQAALVRELSQRPRTYPTQEQITALARDVAAVRETLQQVGKRNARRISLPHLRLPCLSPALLLIPVILLVLWAMWHSWDTLWSALRTLFQ